jgi:hypothetical protein
MLICLSGLAISDLLMALNFLISTSANLSGRGISDPAQYDLCNVNGFLAQLFVVQSKWRTRAT